MLKKHYNIFIKNRIYTRSVRIVLVVMIAISLFMTACNITTKITKSDSESTNSNILDISKISSTSVQLNSNGSSKVDEKTPEDIALENLIIEQTKRIKSYQFKTIENITKSVNALEKMEVTFDISVDYSNGDQYNQTICEINAYILTPKGKTDVMPAFYKGGENKKWAMRYTPLVEGAYTYYLKDEKNGLKSQSQSFTVNAPKTTNRGFIATKGNKFVDSYGKQFTILGTNFAWGTPKEFSEILPLYKEHDMNWIRFWSQCDWSAYNLESKKGTVIQSGESCTYNGLGDYSTGNADRLDTLIQQFEQNDVYMQFCIFNLWDFDSGHWSKNAYNKENGGPCSWKENNTDYWTNPIARKYQKQFIRYIYSRWGYSRSIGMFEYWNECDNKVDTKKRATRDNWHKDLDEFIKALDIYDRPTTTSYAWKDHLSFNSTGTGSEPWQTQEFFDAANIHMYVSVDVDPVKQWVDQLYFTAKQHPGDKPVFIGEYSETNAEFLPLKPGTDRYFTEGIWTPIFFGNAAGSNLYWRSNTSFKPTAKMLDSMKTAASFLKPFANDILTMDYKYNEVVNNLRIGYFKNKTSAIAYIRDEKSPYNLDNARTVSDASIKIDGFDNGNYKIKFVDTLSGRVIKESTLDSDNGILKIKIPSFKRNVAISIIKP